MTNQSETYSDGNDQPIDKALTEIKTAPIDVEGYRTLRFHGGALKVRIDALPPDLKDIGEATFGSILDLFGFIELDGSTLIVDIVDDLSPDTATVDVVLALKTNTDISSVVNNLPDFTQGLQLFADRIKVEHPVGAAIKKILDDAIEHDGDTIAALAKGDYETQPLSQDETGHLEYLVKKHLGDVSDTHKNDVVRIFKDLVYSFNGVEVLTKRDLDLMSQDKVGISMRFNVTKVNREEADHLINLGRIFTDLGIKTENLSRVVHKLDDRGHYLVLQDEGINIIEDELEFMLNPEMAVEILRIHQQLYRSGIKLNAGLLGQISVIDLYGKKTGVFLLPTQSEEHTFEQISIVSDLTKALDNNGVKSRDEVIEILRSLQKDTEGLTEHNVGLIYNMYLRIVEETRVKLDSYKSNELIKVTKSMIKDVRADMNAVIGKVSVNEYEGLNPEMVKSMKKRVLSVLKSKEKEKYLLLDGAVSAEDVDSRSTLEILFEQFCSEQEMRSYEIFQSLATSDTWMKDMLDYVKLFTNALNQPEFNMKLDFQITSYDPVVNQNDEISIKVNDNEGNPLMSLQYTSADEFSEVVMYELAQKRDRINYEHMQEMLNQTMVLINQMGKMRVDFGYPGPGSLLLDSNAIEQ